MVRQKDEELALACGEMALAAREALDWLGDNQRVVGSASHGLERVLKRRIVDANRLARAARRSMSAAVFGPSQSGKSFLIGKFITPGSRTAMAVFGQGADAEKLDFLTQVNPQGGKETTGLVTRFTLQNRETPPGFPVCLKLLREVDLVKILVNSFALDLSAISDDRQTLERPWLDALVDDLRPERAAQPGMRIEEVLELRQYLTESLPKHPYVLIPHLAEAYWPAMEDLIPRLPPAKRVAALSPLWGCLPEFDSLFSDLKAALDSLAHPETIFAPMETIRDTSKGILHVDRIYELYKDGSAGAQMVQICLENGTRVSLRKAVVTALTAELRITIDTPPWPFLNHTDLLDFPGARSREDSTPENCLRSGKNSEKPPKEHCFLRGKVAILFDNYVADYDLNIMMLCIAENNLEVRKLPELVENWIVRTHGEEPARRSGRQTSLFFCMTKCDRLFNISAGGSLKQQIENRFHTNFDEFPGWTREWVPGAPFDNTFLLRNPRAEEQPRIFTYTGAAAEGLVRDEADLAPEFTATVLPAFREALTGSTVAKAHLGALVEKAEALLSINDGGTTFLAEALTPVSDPELKYQQLRPRAISLCHDLTSLLTPYFESDNVAERAEIRRKAVLDGFRGLGANPLGLVLRELCVEDVALRQAYFDYLRHGHDAEDAPAAAQPAAGSGFSIDLGELLEKSPANRTEPAPALPRDTYGTAAVSRWVDGLLRKSEEPNAMARLGLSREQFRTFVDELEGGARRLGLANWLDRHAERIVSYRQPPSVTASAVALGASLIINDYVADAGRGLVERDPNSDPERVRAAAGAFSRPPDLPPGALPDLPATGDDLAKMHRSGPTEWAKAFLELTWENASSAAGRLIDPAQNARLGSILQRFRMP
ncbi:MAG: hypothetical protein HQL41_04280 [Alphaproteobacteria bacterium]|nr:hypothetical protein [Alphaproteobacteria bacterium]